MSKSIDSERKESKAARRYQNNSECRHYSGPNSPSSITEKIRYTKFGNYMLGVWFKEDQHTGKIVRV